MSSHSVYNVKSDNFGSLRLKPRLNLHGYEDSSKDFMKSDCDNRIRFILTNATFNGQNISRAYVKAALLQTGLAQHDKNVIPPRE